MPATDTSVLCPAVSYTESKTYYIGNQFVFVRGDTFDEENYGVKYANDCEVCKIVSKEFVTLLKESEGKSEVLVSVS